MCSQERHSMGATESRIGFYRFHHVCQGHETYFIRSKGWACHLGMHSQNTQYKKQLVIFVEFNYRRATLWTSRTVFEGWESFIPALGQS